VTVCPRCARAPARPARSGRARAARTGGTPDICQPPQDLTYSCADRYAGVGDKDVADISEDDVRDLAWSARRRALQRTVRRNVTRAKIGKPPLLSDGRGAAPSAIQGCRWLLGCFQRNRDLPEVTVNVAAAVKLPTSQERPSRSLDHTELLQAYRVAVTTGRDPELDGLLMRHQLIHAVRAAACSTPRPVGSTPRRSPAGTGTRSGRPTAPGPRPPTTSPRCSRTSSSAARASPHPQTLRTRSVGPAC